MSFLNGAIHLITKAGESSHPGHRRAITGDVILTEMYIAVVEPQAVIPRKVHNQSWHECEWCSQLHSIRRLE